MIQSQRPRRRFLRIGVTGILTALLAKLPSAGLAQSPGKNDKGIVLHEDEGMRIITRRKVPINIKISKAQHGVEGISFCVEEMSPGSKMRVHKHLNNDEIIFIHRGQGTLTLDDQVTEVKTGSVAFVPRGAWHGLDNTGSETLHMIFQYSPAGFEEFFVENGTPAGMPIKVRTEEELTATAKKYGMVYK
ncbi:MAG TPA: cupin domain-containing protein [Cyclobacteriaceae bacterium]|nr:cupin domain-containing protein [Cyclobacteriaceae bacterium]